MGKEIRKIWLHDDIVEGYESYSKEQLVSDCIKNITSTMNNIKGVLSIDYDNISDDAYYDLNKRIYSIGLENDDYLSILELITKQKYARLVQIKTDIFSDDIRNGHGGYDEYYQQVFQLYFVVAMKDNDKLYM